MIFKFSFLHTAQLFRGRFQCELIPGQTWVTWHGDDMGHNMGQHGSHVKGLAWVAWHGSNTGRVTWVRHGAIDCARTNMFWYVTHVGSDRFVLLWIERYVTFSVTLAALRWQLDNIIIICKQTVYHDILELLVQIESSQPKKLVSHFGSDRE